MVHGSRLRTLSEHWYFHSQQAQGEAKAAAGQQKDSKSPSQVSWTCKVAGQQYGHTGGGSQLWGRTGADLS